MPPAVGSVQSIDGLLCTAPRHILATCHDTRSESRPCSVSTPTPADRRNRPAHSGSPRRPRSRRRRSRWRTYSASPTSSAPPTSSASPTWSASPRSCSRRRWSPRVCSCPRLSRRLAGGRRLAHRSGAGRRPARSARLRGGLPRLTGVPGPARVETNARREHREQTTSRHEVNEGQSGAERMRAAN